MRYRTLLEFQEQPGKPGIVLIIKYEVAITAKRMPRDAATIVKAMDSMHTTTVLLFFQSTYVLSTKKLSEQMSDIWVKHE